MALVVLASPTAVLLVLLATHNRYVRRSNAVAVAVADTPPPPPYTRIRKLQYLNESQTA
jgi:hypothetical protein